MLEGYTVAVANPIGAVGGAGCWYGGGGPTAGKKWVRNGERGKWHNDTRYTKQRFRDGLYERLRLNND